MRSPIFLATLAMALSVHAQVVTLSPAQPLIGQALAVTYDAVAGSLPDNATQASLHWGLLDPDTGNWSLPPDSNWPAGSTTPDGFALRSPMPALGGGLFSVTVPSTTPMEHIAFVVTDGTNWDNNGGANWVVDYMATDVVCWWSPQQPETGDVVSVFYNTGPGSLGGAIQLHWGVNEVGHGNWDEPPQAIWPAGTVPAGDGMAVRTPMVDLGGGVWGLQIPASEGISSLHWVFTTGSAWDTNGGLNWDLYVGEPPVFAQVWHRFRFDPRSSFYSGTRPVTQAALAGTMNGWSTTATPLSLQADGTWIADMVLQEGAYQYKFVANGNQWTPDPDNPLMNANDNNNSMLELAPAEAPVATGWSVPDLQLRRQTGAVELALGLRAPDGGEALDPASFTALVNSSTVAHSWDGDSLRITVPFATEGEQRVVVTVADVEGDAATFRWAGACQATGWKSLDAERDDNGPGAWAYPTPFSGYADIQAVELLEAALGDTLQVRVKLRMLHDYSRVNLLLVPSANAPLSADHLRDELNTPDWSLGGFAISLMKPSSPHLDPAQDNRLMTDHTPLTAGAPLTVWSSGSSLVANLPMDLLEDRLGTWREAWQLACFAEVTGVAPVDGGVTELGTAQGALAEAWDCDVYDAAFVQPSDLEDALLGNASLGRTASLDAVGRGLVSVTPQEVGPHMAAEGPLVRISTRGGHTVTASRQIRGSSSTDTQGLVRLVRSYPAGQDSVDLPLTGGQWSTSLTLMEGVNHFQAFARDSSGAWGSSAAVEITYIRDHAPQPLVSITQTAGVLQLFGTATVDIDGDISSWLWEADATNPAPVAISNATQNIATIPTPPTVDGAYWLTLTVGDAQGHQGQARGLFEVENGLARPVGQGDYPLWVRDAIVYEIFVRSFDPGRDLASVTERLDEIVDLGANTIWFMPIFEGPSDHGYAVSDYMAVEQDYGSLEDLRSLVEEAHARGLRIVLDMVLNHSSIDHPWMREAQDYGADALSHGYYMWNGDGSHQYYYDWSSLPNFNVSSADYKHEATALSRYWLEDVGVDGYRCDVAWGPQERDPQFWRDWRRGIRRLRPDVLLLGEAGATEFSIYDGRFNLAYDWPLFWDALDVIQNVAPSTLQDRVSNVGFWFPDNGLPFRFLENHDEDRFISSHTAAQTRCAAALLFSLPGVPLIYAGQEVGEASPRGLINWSDPQDLRPFYRQLCQTRTAMAPLRTNQRVTPLTNTDPSQIYSMARVSTLPDEGVVLCAYNLSDNARTAQLTLPVADWGMAEGHWYLTDLFNGEVLEYTTGAPGTLSLSFTGWQPRWLLLADHSVEVGLPDPATTRPQGFQLGQPWPNPFNPRLSIPFVLDSPRTVQVDVCNVAGQRVAVLAQGLWAAGEHQLSWDGSGQASGLYIVRAQAGQQEECRKVLLVK